MLNKRTNNKSGQGSTPHQSGQKSIPFIKELFPTCPFSKLISSINVSFRRSLIPFPTLEELLFPCTDPRNTKQKRHFSLIMALQLKRVKFDCIFIQIIRWRGNILLLGQWRVWKISNYPLKCETFSESRKLIFYAFQWEFCSKQAPSLLCVNFFILSVKNINGQSYINDTKSCCLLSVKGKQIP